MEKRKHRFNIVDAVVILLFAAVVVAFIVTSGKGKKDENADLTFVMQTLQGSVDDMIPDSLASNVSPGDAVFDKESGRQIGTVVTCDSRPAQYTSRSGGVVTEVAGYKTLYITCEATALDEGGKYSVNGVAVSSGRTYTLMFPNLICRAECVSVEGAAGAPEQ